MSIIYICITVLISTVIISFSVYKSIIKLSLSINNLGKFLLSEKGTVIQHYSGEKENEQNNVFNASDIYENNIIEATMNAHGKIFDSPTIATGMEIYSNSKDDDLEDISNQLKRMNKNER